MHSETFYCFSVVLSYISFPKTFSKLVLLERPSSKKNFKNTVQISNIENDFQKDVEDDFRKESSIKEKKQKKFILISLSYTISLVSYLI